MSQFDLFIFAASEDGVKVKVLGALPRLVSVSRTLCFWYKLKSARMTRSWGNSSTKAHDQGLQAYPTLALGCVVWAFGYDLLWESWRS